MRGDLNNSESDVMGGFDSIDLGQRNKKGKSRGKSSQRINKSMQSATHSKHKGKSRRPQSSDPYNMSDLGSVALEKRQSAIKSILEESDGEEDEEQIQRQIKISRKQRGKYYDDRSPVSSNAEERKQKLKKDLSKKKLVNK